MRVRTLLIVTALLSSVLGAVVAYLVLTVPNDVQAAALMKTARKQIAAGDNDHARQSLSRIVQQYPRTDAAAAATVALASIEDNERHKLAAELNVLRSVSTAQQKQLAALGQRIDEIAARPIPQPVIIQAAPKKTTVKKAPAKRRTTSRRRH
jgi:predicted negative regulator of RcsB-dependent stress response